MANGLRAISRLAEQGPLAFSVTVVTHGGLQVWGRPVPVSEWAELHQSAFENELGYVRSTLTRKQRSTGTEQELASTFERMQNQIEVAMTYEGPDCDELLLVDVTYIAIGAPAPMSLPIARVPFASISAWWVVSGKQMGSVAAAWMLAYGHERADLFRGSADRRSRDDTVVRSEGAVDGRSGDADRGATYVAAIRCH
jgi:hypothetical protein